MNSKIAQILLTAVLTLIGTIHSTQANATPWTITTSGIIGQGTDWTGTFINGSTYNNLSGLNFTMVTTIDPMLQPNPAHGIGYNYDDGNNPIPYSETVTLNNVTKTFNGVTTFSGSYLYTYGQVYGGNVDNLAEQDQYGYTADGSYLLGYQWIFGVADFGLTLDFDQTWSYIPTGSESWSSTFEINGSDGTVFFSSGSFDGGRLTSISAHSSESTVPEPGTLALFATTLLAFAAVRRKRDR